MPQWVNLPVQDLQAVLKLRREAAKVPAAVPPQPGKRLQGARADENAESGEARRHGLRRKAQAAQKYLPQQLQSLAGLSTSSESDATDSESEQEHAVTSTAHGAAARAMLRRQHVSFAARRTAEKTLSSKARRTRRIRQHIETVNAIRDAVTKLLAPPMLEASGTTVARRLKAELEGMDGNMNQYINGLMSLSLDELSVDETIWRGMASQLVQFWLRACQTLQIIFAGLSAEDQDLVLGNRAYQSGGHDKGSKRLETLMGSLGTTFARVKARALLHRRELKKSRSNHSTKADKDVQMAMDEEISDYKGGVRNVHMFKAVDMLHEANKSVHAILKKLQIRSTMPSVDILPSLTDLLTSTQKLVGLMTDMDLWTTEGDEVRQEAVRSEEVEHIQNVRFFERSTAMFDQAIQQDLPKRTARRAKARTQFESGVHAMERLVAHCVDGPAVLVKEFEIPAEEKVQKKYESAQLATLSALHIDIIHLLCESCLTDPRVIRKPPEDGTATKEDVSEKGEVVGVRTVIPENAEQRSDKDKEKGVGRWLLDPAEKVISAHSGLINNLRRREEHARKRVQRAEEGIDFRLQRIVAKECAKQMEQLQQHEAAKDAEVRARLLEMKRQHKALQHTAWQVHQEAKRHQARWQFVRETQLLQIKAAELREKLEDVRDRAVKLAKEVEDLKGVVQGCEQTVARMQMARFSVDPDTMALVEDPCNGMPPESCVALIEGYAETFLAEHVPLPEAATASCMAEAADVSQAFSALMRQAVSTNMLDRFRAKLKDLEQHKPKESPRAPDSANKGAVNPNEDSQYPRRRCLIADTRIAKVDADTEQEWEQVWESVCDGIGPRSQCLRNPRAQGLQWLDEVAQSVEPIEHGRIQPLPRYFNGVDDWLRQCDLLERGVDRMSAHWENTDVLQICSDPGGFDSDCDDDTEDEMRDRCLTDTWQHTLLNVCTRCSRSVQAFRRVCAVVGALLQASTEPYTGVEPHLRAFVRDAVLKRVCFAVNEWCNGLVALLESLRNGLNYHNVIRCLTGLLAEAESNRGRFQHKDVDHRMNAFDMQTLRNVILEGAVSLANFAEELYDGNPLPKTAMNSAHIVVRVALKYNDDFAKSPEVFFARNFENVMQGPVYNVIADHAKDLKRQYHVALEFMSKGRQELKDQAVEKDRIQEDMVEEMLERAAYAIEPLVQLWRVENSLLRQVSSGTQLRKWRAKLRRHTSSSDLAHREYSRDTHVGIGELTADLARFEHAHPAPPTAAHLVDWSAALTSEYSLLMSLDASDRAAVLWCLGGAAFSDALEPFVLKDPQQKIEGVAVSSCWGFKWIPDLSLAKRVLRMCRSRTPSPDTKGSAIADPIESNSVIHEARCNDVIGSEHDKKVAEQHMNAESTPVSTTALAEAQMALQFNPLSRSPSPAHLFQELNSYHVGSPEDDSMNDGQPAVGSATFAIDGALSPQVTQDRAIEDYRHGSGSSYGSNPPAFIQELGQTVSAETILDTPGGESRGPEQLASWHQAAKASARKQPSSRLGLEGLRRDEVESTSHAIGHGGAQRVGVDSESQGYQRDSVSGADGKAVLPSIGNSFDVNAAYPALPAGAIEDDLNVARASLPLDADAMGHGRAAHPAIAGPMDSAADVHSIDGDTVRPNADISQEPRASFRSSMSQVSLELPIERRSWQAFGGVGESATVEATMSRDEAAVRMSTHEARGSQLGRAGAASEESAPAAPRAHESSKVAGRHFDASGNHGASRPAVEEEHGGMLSVLGVLGDFANDGTPILPTTAERGQQQALGISLGELQSQDQCESVAHTDGRYPPLLALPTAPAQPIAREGRHPRLSGISVGGPSEEAASRDAHMVPLYHTSSKDLGNHMFGDDPVAPDDAAYYAAAEPGEPLEAFVGESHDEHVQLVAAGLRVRVEDVSTAHAESVSERKANEVPELFDLPPRFKNVATKVALAKRLVSPGMERRLAAVAAAREGIEREKAVAAGQELIGMQAVGSRLATRASQAAIQADTRPGSPSSPRSPNAPWKTQQVAEVLANTRSRIKKLASNVMAELCGVKTPPDGSPSHGDPASNPESPDSHPLWKKAQPLVLNKIRKKKASMWAAVRAAQKAHADELQTEDWVAHEAGGRPQASEDDADSDEELRRQLSQKRDYDPRNLSSSSSTRGPRHRVSQKSLAPTTAGPPVLKKRLLPKDAKDDVAPQAPSARSKKVVRLRFVVDAEVSPSGESDKDTSSRSRAAEESRDAFGLHDVGVEPVQARNLREIDSPIQLQRRPSNEKTENIQALVPPTQPNSVELSAVETQLKVETEKLDRMKQDLNELSRPPSAVEGTELGRVARLIESVQTIFPDLKHVQLPETNVRNGMADQDVYFWSAAGAEWAKNIASIPDDHKPSAHSIFTSNQTAAISGSGVAKEKLAIAGYLQKGDRFGLWRHRFYLWLLSLRLADSEEQRNLLQADVYLQGLVADELVVRRYLMQRLLGNWYQRHNPAAVTQFGEGSVVAAIQSAFLRAGIDDTVLAGTDLTAHAKRAISILAEEKLSARARILQLKQAQRERHKQCVEMILGDWMPCQEDPEAIDSYAQNKHPLRDVISMLQALYDDESGAQPEEIDTFAQWLVTLRECALRERRLPGADEELLHHAVSNLAKYYADGSFQHDGGEEETVVDTKTGAQGKLDQAEELAAKKLARLRARLRPEIAALGCDEQLAVLERSTEISRIGTELEADRERLHNLLSMFADKGENREGSSDAGSPKVERVGDVDLWDEVADRIAMPWWICAAFLHWAWQSSVAGRHGRRSTAMRSQLVQRRGGASISSMGSDMSKVSESEGSDGSPKKKVQPIGALRGLRGRSQNAQRVASALGLSLQGVQVQQQTNATVAQPDTATQQRSTDSEDVEPRAVVPQDDAQEPDSPKLIMRKGTIRLDLPQGWHSTEGTDSLGPVIGDFDLSDPIAAIYPDSLDVPGLVPLIATPEPADEQLAGVENAFSPHFLLQAQSAQVRARLRTAPAAPTSQAEISAWIDLPLDIGLDWKSKILQSRAFLTAREANRKTGFPLTAQQRNQQQMELYGNFRVPSPPKSDKKDVSNALEGQLIAGSPSPPIHDVRDELVTDTGVDVSRKAASVLSPMGQAADIARAATMGSISKRANAEPTLQAGFATAPGKASQGGPVQLRPVVTPRRKQLNAAHNSSAASLATVSTTATLEELDVGRLWRKCLKEVWPSTTHAASPRGKRRLGACENPVLPPLQGVSQDRKRSSLAGQNEPGPDRRKRVARSFD